MENEYPLFPRLSEAGAKEAQQLIDKFKEKLKSAADEVLSEMYCEVIHDIESDSWCNFRNDLLDGFKNYDNRKIQNRYDFKKIRQAILKEHREDIIKDLNQDMVDEIKELKESRTRLQEMRSRF